MNLTEQEIVRYSRHIILPEVGGRGQKRLKSASVLLAGLGASGSAAALYLAAAGVGHLTLWDPELLAPQDLEGAIAHTADRVGTPRARSAAVPLSRINPDAAVEPLDRDSDVIGAVPAHQVVLASAGNWHELLSASLSAGADLILYAAHGAVGAASACRRGQPCLACMGEERARSLSLFPEGSGAMAAAAGVIGVMAATEAIKIILGIGQPLFGRVLVYDGWSATFHSEEVERLPGCPVCGRF